MADIEKTIKELKDGLDFKIYDSTCVLLEVSTVSNALELLKDRPKIVRCKDCRWYGADYECDNAHSPCFHNGSISDNWFCADGEPKDGEQE